MANINLTVATPVYGEILFTPYVQSLLRLQRVLHQRGGAMRHATVSYAYITDSRNYLLTHWFDKSESSHLLFVDADMGFEPQLILDMIALDKPVIGVIYAKRQVDLDKLARLSAAGEPAERAIARAHDFIVRPVRGRAPRRLKGFMEVEGCGTGIMLIKRTAIAAMLETLPQINDTNAKKTSPLAGGLDRLIRAFDTVDVDGVPLVDDFAFCHRWQALCKGELWARIDESVTHIGLHKFNSRYSDAGAGGPRITVTKAAEPRPGERAREGRTGDGAPKIVKGRLPVPDKSKPSGK